MAKFNYKYDDLFNPVLKAIKNLGGSGANTEIQDEITRLLNLSDEEVNDIHRGSTTKLAYRLQWARNYLKRFGILENSQRGVWSLTERGKKISQVDKREVKNKVKEFDKQKDETETDEANIFIEKDNGTWQDKVIETVQKMSPKQFEQLCQRLLRELGFINVEVTGRAGDGGIDGKGIIRLGGVLSFHVVFQSKRYRGSVPPSIVRDFRGAMSGRADKGLLITTGSFTKEARREAQREGAVPIDLIDGNDFAEKLRELKLGITIEIIEKVVIDEEWFKRF